MRMEQAAALSWRVLVVVAAAWLAVLALVRLRLVVLPAIIALLLSTLLAPVALWLRERGRPRLLATWAVVLGALLVLGGTFAVLGPQVVERERQHHRGREDLAQRLKLTIGPSTT
jgi:predicted PurR-regulated permease PerM